MKGRPAEICFICHLESLSFNITFKLRRRVIMSESETCCIEILQEKDLQVLWGRTELGVFYELKGGQFAGAPVK